MEYRAKLALAKEEAGEIKAAVLLKNKNKIEEQRRVARNVWRMEGKMKGGNTTKVVIEDKHGDVIELSENTKNGTPNRGW